MSQRAEEAADDWWLIGNCHYGMHVARGNGAVEAKGDARSRIAASFAGSGLSPSASARAASSYHVFVIAGPLPEQAVKAARDAWDQGDAWPAAELAESSGHRKRMMRP